MMDSEQLQEITSFWEDMASNSPSVASIAALGDIRKLVAEIEHMKDERRYIGGLAEQFTACVRADIYLSAEKPLKAKIEKLEAENEVLRKLDEIRRSGKSGEFNTDEFIEREAKASMALSESNDQ